MCESKNQFHFKKKKESIKIKVAVYGCSYVNIFKK